MADETPPQLDDAPIASTPKPDEAVRPLLDDAPIASMPKALIAGLVAAAIGGAVWAAIAVSTGYEIGWIAIGIGFLCGMAVRLGKGTTGAFRAVGALTSLAGIAFGKLFTVFYLAGKEQVSIDIGQAIDLVVQNGSPIDLLFIAIAVWQGWKLSVTGG